jgi:TRAP-type C4-dicarboxylate transport system substrate-binding protein
MDEPFNALLGRAMPFEKMKEAMWRAAFSSIKDGDSMEIKVGTLAPPGTPYLNVPETILIPRLKGLSGGKLLIKIYGSGTMGEDTDILRKMDIGQLDVCGCTALGILAAAPESALFLLPGLFRNYDEVDYITTTFRKRLDRFYEEKGYILAGIIDTGFFYLFLKNKITCIADVKQQKVLTWFGIVETALYKELGIDATPVAVPEVVSALSTGMANACLGPAAWMLGMQAYQYTNYYVKPALLYSPGAMIVSMNVKERLRKQFSLSETLADNIVELLLSEILSLEPDWQRQIRLFEEKSLKAFEVKCGMKAVSLSPEDLKRLEVAATGVQRALAGKTFPEELLKEIVNALETYRAQK